MANEKPLQDEMSEAEVDANIAEAEAEMEQAELDLHRDDKAYLAILLASERGGESIRGLTGDQLDIVAKLTHSIMLLMAIRLEARWPFEADGGDIDAFSEWLKSKCREK